MTVFRGHTETAGHFLQLATMAIGHKVIALLFLSLFQESFHIRYETDTNPDSGFPSQQPHSMQKPNTESNDNPQ
jgi:hypothetical protein